jgi:hypothetical protein
MTKFLIFATAITAVLAQGQTPKLPDRKPDINSVRQVDLPKIDPAKLDPAKLIPAKLDPSKLDLPKVDPLSLPMPASFNLKEALGGPLRIPIKDANKVVPTPSPTVLNERSTLSRKAFILNDANCPVLIEELNATPEVGKDWRMVLSGQIRARSAITAADIRFVLFDLFGSHLSTQQKVIVEDIGADDLALVYGLSWGTSEREVKVLHTTFAFVARVRLANGNVWKYDPLDVARALAKLQLRIDPARLEPSETVAQ